MTRPIITLTTDFGLADAFVGAMKGVILSALPEADIVDITHGVEPFNVLDGALAIAQAAPYFPRQTVHVVVVDPGVGTARRPLLVASGGQFFVGPDNGVLSIAWQCDPASIARHITADHYFRQPVSGTFHGRDIFAPVAAALARTFEPAPFGPEVKDALGIEIPKPRIDGDTLRGKILRVDRFGNLLTNLTTENAPCLFAPGVKFRMIIGAAEVTRMVKSFGDGPEGEPVAYLGSSGYLELGVNRGHAARQFGAARDADLLVEFL
jgi:S-adenosyl-L-methionine hydrolase (adenosine-forming)